MQAAVIPKWNSKLIKSQLCTTCVEAYISKMSYLFFCLHIFLLVNVARVARLVHIQA